MPTAKPWALGWLAETDCFVELARELNLCTGPDADDEIELEAAAIHHVSEKTWWPNLMQCHVNGSIEAVFAVYVDFMPRSYPPDWIPRAELIERKYVERLKDFMELDERPQWFTCKDGSYTPWRYRGAVPPEGALWMDVSIYRPHPDTDYDRDAFIENMDEDQDGEVDDEELDCDYGADDAEGNFSEEGDYVDEEADELEGESAVDDAELTTADIPHSRDSSEDLDQVYESPRMVDAASTVNVSEGVLGALSSPLGMCDLSTTP